MERTSLAALGILLICMASPARAAAGPPAPGKTVSLFEGKSLAGWEGNPALWRVEDGALTGGSRQELVKRNEFLASVREYTNFIVRFKIKLSGTEGFINSGFQIRSQRVPGSSEMAGYQCDFGEPNWYGAIYDEARRNKVMSASDLAALRPVLRPQDWNDYVIRADGSRITTWINGVMGTDYYELDLSIANYNWGRLGIQVHGGGKALVQVKDISIEELPAHPEFIGALEAKDTGMPSPLTPQEELASFSLPPGFEIELVASEDIAAGLGKFVALDWDAHGRLWTMTALEYPVDANESPEVARELYVSKAKDKVLVYDRDPDSPTGYAAKPRVFAEGLAIPLGILPYKDGVYVQHGSEIVYLSDTDGDGRADKREVILSGFGVQDSHLFPHQFTRAPGNWIWMAQGAFNYGKVTTTTGQQKQFDQTRMAKFRHDGSEFDITSQGPCNIWGLVLDGNGQAWIQEANDYGYPMMPFHEYANYPGCSNPQWKSYAPEFPGTAPEFAMGGTGLSGLALSDAPEPTAEKSSDTKDCWPAPYAGIFYIANPITRKIQAIQVTADGVRFRYQKLPDFLLSSDAWFRPVALRTGPDGCLYLVDWYNRIISHNEVPRNHPERDKVRGRIWRIKHRTQTPFAVPDFTRLSSDELLAKLGAAPLAQSHLAWQAITDRQLLELAPRLKSILTDPAQPTPRRIAALWALEGLKQTDAGSLKPLLGEGDRNLRREALRALAEVPQAAINDIASLVDDPDPEVRAQVARTTGWRLAHHIRASDDAARSEVSRAFEVLLRLARPSLSGPTMKSTQNGRTIKIKEAYDREFERYLVRFLLEQHPGPLAEFLNSEAAKSLPVENRLLATLALDPKTSATQVAALLPQITRPIADEELLRLAQFPEDTAANNALRTLLNNPDVRTGILESLLRLRTKIDAAELESLLTDTARQLLLAPDQDTTQLGIAMASSFKLAASEPDLAKLVETTSSTRPALAVAALQALRELKSDRVELFADLAMRHDALEEPALAALAASRHPAGPQKVITLFPSLALRSRRAALAGLASTRAGGEALVRAVQAGVIAREELDGASFEKLEAVLHDDSTLYALLKQVSPESQTVLRLNGNEDAWTETDLVLEGPFTVETWIKLEPNIRNNDGIFSVPGKLDMNFHDAHFRVWIGGGPGDVVVARKSMIPDAWIHLAATRDADGRFRLYQNGELNSDASPPVPEKFEKLRIGWTTAGKGTAAWLTDFRVWNRARTAEEIRADFDRRFDTEPMPAGLIFQARGQGDWGRLQPGATPARTLDYPRLLTTSEADALAQKFATYRALANHPGDIARGAALFSSVCTACHSVGGKGGQIGPVLNGAGALGVEALLRNVLTPNAAMEPGYRTFRVMLKEDEMVEGLFVSQDAEAIVLRRQNVPDLRIPMNTVKHAGFTHRSMMPEGLLEGMKPEEVSDLFAYLRTLK